MCPKGAYSVCDRLGTAKEVAQVAAVIGRDFSYELLHAVDPMPEEDLRRALHKLTDAELLYARGIAPDATYQFKHALIQDAAYEALLRSGRRELHLIVARTIDGKFPSLKETHPEVLARHWTEAGQIDATIAEWSRAGKTSESRNAFSEALENYQKAISLIVLLPEPNERDLRELELRHLAFIMIRLTKDFSAPDVIEAAERAATLAEKSGNLTQLGDWMMARCLPALIAGDLPSAGMFADQALEFAIREGAPTRIAHVQTLQVLTHYYRGDFAGSEEHFGEQGENRRTPLMVYV